MVGRDMMGEESARDRSTKRGAIVRVLRRALRMYKRLEWRLVTSPRSQIVEEVTTRKAARKASGESFQDRPHVSVIVQSFNQVRNIRRLEARLRATCMGELIVCEDGSIDGSDDQWKRRLRKPNDFLIRSNDLHEIRTYSRAIDYARGEFICLMQDDDHPPKDGSWLVKALELFKYYPRLAVIGGFCGFHHYFDQVYNAPTWWADGGGPPRVEIPYRDPYTQKPLIFVENVNIGPYLLRKETYQRLGGFDVGFSEPSAPGICFESEFCLRAWKNGWEVALVDIPVKNRHFGDGGTFLWGKAERDRNRTRNQKLIVELYHQHLPAIQRRVQEANRRLIDR